MPSLVGSEMCIRDRSRSVHDPLSDGIRFADDLPIDSEVRNIGEGSLDGLLVSAEPFFRSCVSLLDVWDTSVFQQESEGFSASLNGPVTEKRRSSADHLMKA
eukprot:TRINITY_DN6894_c0_g1_i4.p2 TRINITY_DN6894_c0_g1~~TRINITY_DN6894_c0_g1_i4.p2  ORF type:complete len:102 (-),score=16.36 TRINITY_DN6894_c0_g1_i4:265-570(-)